ncbi:MAG: efflux RND transporter periplasmic adaptor subunit [Hyphomicrobiales bacterium]|nr:efflux RND transporter periplasmic adaptor subunit [Hyphomicrobiales bacterium]
MKPIDIAAKTRDASRLRRIGMGVAKVLLPVIVVAATVAGYRTLVATKPEVPSRLAQERVFQIDAVTARFENRQPVLRLFGEVVAGREVELRALVSGEIVGVTPDLRVGATIPAGSEVIRIDEFSYRGAVVEAEANLREAEAGLQEIEANIQSERDALESAREQLELAIRDRDRAVELQARGNISDQTVEVRELSVSERRQSVRQRENNVTIQTARAEQRRAQIARLEWEVEKAERDLQNTSLRTPFEGIVSEENADVGRMVSTNDLVVRLSKKSDLEVAFTLSDAQFGRLIADGESLVGRSLEVFWNVGNAPVMLSGTVKRIAPQIEAATGGVAVFAEVANIDGTPLRPGAFVEVRIPDQMYENVLVIPEPALFPNDTVYAVEDGRLSPREIDVVGYDGTGILVRGDIDDGMPVLITPLSEAGAGLKVEIRNREDAVAVGRDQ